MDEPDNIIPIICGPTGSGKTAAGVKLSESFPSEIVSADSRQIIKYLDIGTAKPSQDERQKVPFHLIDIIEPGERYSAFNFIDDAENAIKLILSRKKLPLIVGGTGLYLRALTDGVVEISNEDFEIREKLENELLETSTETMHRKLQEIDPLEAAKIHPNNKHRIIRALEIFYLTGRTKSELITTGKYKKPNYRFQYYCLAPQRELLYQRINDRVDGMLADGLLEEIESLIKNGLKEQLLKANVIGYTELIKYLDGNFLFDEAVSVIKQNSRRYAKRQMTWFRKQENLQFFQNSKDLEAALTGMVNGC